MGAGCLTWPACSGRCSTKMSRCAANRPHGQRSVKGASNAPADNGALTRSYRLTLLSGPAARMRGQPPAPSLLLRSGAGNRGLLGNGKGWVGLESSGFESGEEAGLRRRAWGGGESPLATAASDGLPSGGQCGCPMRLRGSAQ